MAKLKSKIKAFTILESMVSIVIVMIVFSLSSLVVINVTSSGMNKKNQNAYMFVKAFRNESVNQDRLFDETIELEGLRIEKRLEAYKNSVALKILYVRAFEADKLLTESKEILFIPENQ